MQYVGIGNIVITALERFLALRKPFFHRRFVTRRKILYGTIALFVFSGCIAQINIVDKSKDKFAFFIFDSALTITSTMVVLTLLVITYITVQRSLQAKLDEARSTMELNGNPSGHFERLIKAELAKESRLICLFMTIAIAYIVGFLPNSIFIMAYERYIHDGGKRWNAVTYLKAQIAFFALSVSPALFDPALTLYLKYDYHEYILRAIGAISRSTATGNPCNGGATRMPADTTGL